MSYVPFGALNMTRFFESLDIQHLQDVATLTGGWEGWLQVELALWWRGARRDLHSDREAKVYQKQKDKRVDLILQDKKNGQTVVVELKCKRAKESPESFAAALKKDLNKIKDLKNKDAWVYGVLVLPSEGWRVNEEESSDDKEKDRDVSRESRRREKDKGGDDDRQKKRKDDRSRDKDEKRHKDGDDDDQREKREDRSLERGGDRAGKHRDNDSKDDGRKKSDVRKESNKDAPRSKEDPDLAGPLFIVRDKLEAKRQTSLADDTTTKTDEWIYFHDSSMEVWVFATNYRT